MRSLRWRRWGVPEQYLVGEGEDYDYIDSIRRFKLGYVPFDRLDWSEMHGFNKYQCLDRMIRRLESPLFHGSNINNNSKIVLQNYLIKLKK